MGAVTPQTCCRFGESVKILFRWKGSIYKLLWEPFLLYLATYIGVTLLYNFILEDDAKREFEAIAAYCSKYMSSLPIVLLLGFFTSTSMQRWFSVTTSIAGTAKVITAFVLTLKDNAPDGDKIIQQYARWIILSWVLAFRRICKPLRRMYPNLSSLQTAGLLLDHERITLENELELSNDQGDHLSLVVLNWNLTLLRKCNKQGLFSYGADCNRNVDAVLAFKKSCGNTIKFATKNIPVALIQVVSIAVYSIGVASIMARHMSDKHQSTTIITGYLPFLNVFQYFLYFSWLRFGSMATNPFGEDDDDIDIRKLLQSHIEDATRLQAIYTSSLNDQLVTASIENSSDSWLVKTQFGISVNDPLIS